MVAPRSRVPSVIVAAVEPDRGPAAADPGPAFTWRYAVPGLIGTTVLAIGALGVGWVPLDGFADIPLVASWRDEGEFVSRAFVILGGAVLLQAWLVIGGDVMSGHLHSVRRLGAILAAWIVPLLLVPPLFSRDPYSYYAQGKLLLNGVDPYSSGVSSIPGWAADGVDPIWQNTPTPYGPLWLAFSRGVAALVGDNPYLAVIAFRLLAVAGVVLLAVFVPRLAFHHGIDPSKALWLGVMNPLVLMHFVAGAHNDALMVGLIVAGFALAVERRVVLGTLLVVLGSMIKPIGLLALPFVGLVWAGSRSTWGRRWLTWAKVIAITLVAYVALSLVVGVNAGWLRALTTPGEVRTWLSPPTAIGMALGNALDAIGLGNRTDGLVTASRLVFMLAAVAIVAWLVLRPEGRSPVRGAMLAFLTVVTFGPVLQPWYLLWVLPLAAASGVRPRELRWVLVGVALFTLYGLCEPTASADSLLELSDGVALLLAVGAVGAAVSASPRERALLFGEPVDHGLMPEDAPSRARWEQLVVRGAAA